MSTDLIIYASAFLAALFLSDVLWRQLVTPALERRAVRGRLSLQNRAARAEFLLKNARENNESSILQKLRGLTTGAGYALQPQSVLLSMLAVAAIATSLFWYSALLPKGPAMLLSGAIGIALPLAFLAFMRARRLAQFEEQLPDALDTMVRSLRAGHPVSVALQGIAEQMPEPIGPEFGVVNDQISLGLELPEALERMSDRVGHQDLRFMVVAVNIQHMSGGNLSEVLSNLSRVVRARASMMRKKRAVSAEGRLSFWIVTCMPAIFIGLLSILNPNYFGDYWGHPILTGAMILCLILQILCSIVVWRITNFKV